VHYIAHVRESDGQQQSIKAHLLGVQALAESYGAKIGARHIAGLAGLLHDMGKSTEQFRTYLLEAISNPDAPPKRGSVDHSTAGGVLLYELLHTGVPSMYEGLLAEVVGNAIISHHSYLHDFLSPNLESGYLKRVRDKDKVLIGYDQAKSYFFEHVMNIEAFNNYVSSAVVELKVYLEQPSIDSMESKLMFLSKFVFSALIDADRTDTRLFEANKTVEPEPNYKELYQGYYNDLLTEIQSYAERDDSGTRINQLRREMSEKCDQFASKPPGIYTFSIPTGGGKTLASLRYALKHAKHYDKKHIIYVVPYTTIIEQNATEVRKILGDQGPILEHHSNVIDDDQDDEQLDGHMNITQKLKLAKDNWDAPIIFTTMVQFLNVFYAHGSRNSRRMHNLSEAVIIFDEVQKVPVHCVSLFNYALNFLKAYGKSTMVLCTATQPALDFVEHRLTMAKDSEMVEHLGQVTESFRRVEIIDRATEEMFDTDKLATFVIERLEEAPSLLVILNTKKVVKELYIALKESMDIPIYHLSTSMCAAHRNQILTTVREHLGRKERVICISTQLIEAGVDISFDCVIRSLAGLDSIAQAAGRCNRHGTQGIRPVYIIDHEGENLNHLPEIRGGKKIARRLLVDMANDPTSHGGNLLSATAMERYFQEFYTEFSTSLDYNIPKLSKDMIALLASSRDENTYNQAYIFEHKQSLPLFIVNSYLTAAKHFDVIDNQAKSVLVPYSAEGKDIIARLNGNQTIEDLSQLLRKAQLYSINLFRYEQDKLVQDQGLVSLLDGNILALKESAYSQEFGLDLSNESYFEAGIF